MRTVLSILAALILSVSTGLAGETTCARYLGVRKVKAADIPALFSKKGVDYMPLTCINWKAFPYAPESSVAIAASKDAILIHFKTREINAQALHLNDFEPVAADCCFEFFCSLPGSENYYNFEFNCVGAAMVCGGNRPKQRTHSPIISKIDRWCSLPREVILARPEETSWEIALVIPLEAFFLDEPVKTLKGKTLNCNFQKIAWETPLKHFVTWAPIRTETPRMHQPAFFKPIKFVVR